MSFGSKSLLLLVGALAVVGLSSSSWSSASAQKRSGGKSTQPASLAVSAPQPSSTIVISQVYGGGGNTGATYINDYIELKNISNTTQSLNGLSLYYGSSTGQFASAAGNALALPNTTLQPGQYFLVQAASSGAIGVALPITADASSTTMNLSGTNGKVALVNGLAQNSCGATATPCTLPNAQIIDVVAYGTSNNAEGTATAALSSTTGLSRKNVGCTDTDNNSADFDVVSTLTPRNTATTAAPCVTPVPVSISSVGAVPGQIITVPVTIGDVTGKAVSAYDFTMTFDSTKLTPASPAFDTAGTLSSGMTITPNTGTAGRVVISAFGTANLTGSGTLIKMRFTANQAAVGTAALGWQSFVLNEGDPTSSATGGSVIFGRQNSDFNGDGRTDFSITRNSGSSRTWWTATNGTGASTAIQWGVASGDFNTPADFDGDGKADVAIWREGAPDEAAYFIFRSSDSTFQRETFGQTGDDPSVTGDYDGDGKADPAVFRCPSGSAGQCFFFYRASNNNPSRNITYIPWGFGTGGATPSIFPVAGDYDGDAKMDFCVRINNSGAGLYIMLKSANLGVEYIQYGLATDMIVPEGDFDGDGRTDLAVARLNGGNYNIYTLTRAGGGTGASPIIWGITGDEGTLGDYDGDGVTDVAIWRPSDGTFYVRRSTDGGMTTFKWGTNGDEPTASWIFPRGQ